MAAYECARCGYYVAPSQAARDFKGHTVHFRGECPPPPERTPDPVRSAPVKLHLSVRAYCRKGLHNECAGVFVPADVADGHDGTAYVCTCTCHYFEAQPSTSEASED